MRTMRQLLYLALLIPFVLPTPACTDQHRTEMNILDSLDLMLDEAQESLQLDADLFDRRIMELEDQRYAVITGYKDTMDLATGQLMDRHRAIMKRYSRAVAELRFLVPECDSLRKQIEDLRNYVRSSEYDKETFKGYLSKERTDVRSAHQRALDLNREVYEIEPTYMRLSDQVQELIDAMN